MEESDKRNRTPYVPHNEPYDPTTSTGRTAQKHAAKSEYYANLAREAKANCDTADGDDIDLIVDSMAEMALMQGKVEGGGVRQTGGNLINFMVPMLLLFSGDVNAFFHSAGGKVDDIINWFAGWWSTLSDCVRGFWRTIFGTQEHAAAAALLRLRGNQAVREQNTWNYIMGMIGYATTYAMEGASTMGASAMEGVGAMGASAMEGATAFGTAVQTKTQPYIDRAKENPVQFGAGIAAMGSNIYLFGGTVASGAMWLLHFLQDVPMDRWVGAISIIASYLAWRGTGNIEEDKDKLVGIINAVPANVIVATKTTPANIKAVQTNIKTYYTEAQTSGLLAAHGITETAEDGLKRALIEKAAAEQRIASKTNTKKNEANAQITIASLARGRLARLKAAEATRKKNRDKIVKKKRDSAGSGQQTITSLWLDAGAGAGPNAKEGGKRNTKKRSNKKKKTKKHKKKQHRKTKRG